MKLLCLCYERILTLVMQMVNKGSNASHWRIYHFSNQFDCYLCFCVYLLLSSFETHFICYPHSHGSWKHKLTLNYLYIILSFASVGKAAMSKIKNFSWDLQSRDVYNILITFLFHFFKKKMYLFTYFRGRVAERNGGGSGGGEEGNRERAREKINISSICLFTPQIPTPTKIRLGQNQDQQIPSQSPTWVVRIQPLWPFSVASPGL